MCGVLSPFVRFFFFSLPSIAAMNIIPNTYIYVFNCFRQMKDPEFKQYFLSEKWKSNIRGRWIVCCVSFVLPPAFLPYIWLPLQIKLSSKCIFNSLPQLFMCMLFPFPVFVLNGYNAVSLQKWIPVYSALFYFFSHLKEMCV